LLAVVAVLLTQVVVLVLVVTELAQALLAVVLLQNLHLHLSYLPITQ
jgi:hypothetical protein